MSESYKLNLIFSPKGEIFKKLILDKILNNNLFLRTYYNIFFKFFYIKNILLLYIIYF